MLFSNTNQTPDESYLHVLKDVNFRPIFIQGNHRSGTTLLHDLLAQTQCFNFVTAYYVIRRNEILFNHMNGIEDDAKYRLDMLFKSLGLDNRMIDEVAVGHNMPEEYGSILGGYARYILSPKSLPRFIEFCKKVQFVSYHSGSLLLKNPWDYANFMYLKSAFPDAKFIFIHRYPIHIVNSLLKTLRSSLAKKNPFIALLFEKYADVFKNPVALFIVRLLLSSRFDLGVRIVTREIVKTTNYYLQNISSLSENDYISIRYEDICEEPNMTMARILEFLQVEPRTSLNYRVLINPRPVTLLEEVKRNERSILKRFTDYLAYCKYGAISR